MKQIIVLILCTAFLQAGIFDFNKIENANKEYKNKEYKNAIKSYKEVASKDGATYDLANSYYKDAQYKKAMVEYKKVKNPKLKFKTLHNMGNTYAKLGKTDEAIKSYENALKIKKDSDTKFNLDLLKKKKKQEKKKKKKNKKQNKKKKNGDKKKQKKSDSKKQKNSKNPKENKKGEQQKQNKSGVGKKNKQNQNKSNKLKKNKNNKNKSKQQMKKIAPISNMEERKYKKMLNKRGINTLMLPLSTKGGKNDEEKPW